MCTIEINSWITVLLFTTESCDQTTPTSWAMSTVASFSRWLRKLGASLARDTATRRTGWDTKTSSGLYSKIFYCCIFIGLIISSITLKSHISKLHGFIYIVLLLYFLSKKVKLAHIYFNFVNVYVKAVGLPCLLTGPLFGCSGSGGEDRVPVPRVHRRGRPCHRWDHLHLQALTGGSGQSHGWEHPHRWLTLTLAFDTFFHRHAADSKVVW